MTPTDLENLEKLVNYIAVNLVKKNGWRDLVKAEWVSVAEMINKRRENQKASSNEPLGLNYIYEHLILNKIQVWKQAQEPIAAISSPSYEKLNLIARALGYINYIDFIESAAEEFNFNELKIHIRPAIAPINLPLLKNLSGKWYSYNRNLPFPVGQEGEERIWRSSVVIKSYGEDFVVERSGKDNHKYYGRINAYDDYVFIIMNSNTFIRQRHFISRIKDIVAQLKSTPNYKIPLLSLVSTCISFNGEPIALYEIFERQKDDGNFSTATVDLPLDSPDIPPHILAHLKDIGRNRITPH